MSVMRKEPKPPWKIIMLTEQEEKIDNTWCRSQLRIYYLKLVTELKIKRIRIGIEVGITKQKWKRRFIIIWVKMPLLYNWKLKEFQWQSLNEKIQQKNFHPYYNSWIRAPKFTPAQKSCKIMFIYEMNQHRVLKIMN